MRLRLAKLMIIVIVLVNLLLFFFSLRSSLWQNLELRFLPSVELDSLKSLRNGDSTHKQQQQQQQPSPPSSKQNIYEQLRKSITIVFRVFYSFENDIRASIQSILEVVPNIPIVVYLEGAPYPPLTLLTTTRNTSMKSRDQSRPEESTNNNQVQFINLKYDFSQNAEREENLAKNELYPLSVIRTKYALFMPDGVRLSNKSILQKIWRQIHSIEWHNNKSRGGGGVEEQQHQQQQQQQLIRKILIVSFAGKAKTMANCVQMKLDFPNWTIQYTAVNNSNENCDLFLQKHALLMDVEVLKSLPEPLAQPFPEMLYIQAKLHNISKIISPYNFQDGRRLFTAYHTKQHRFDIRRRQFREMYKRLQIKRLIRRIVVERRRSQQHSNNNNHHQQEETIINRGNRQQDFVLDEQFSWGNFNFPLETQIDLIGCERMTKSCIGSVYNQRPFYTYLGKHTPPCCLDKLRSTFNHVLEEFENVGIRYWLDNYALKDLHETNNLSPDVYDIDLSFYQQDLERSNALRKAQSKPYLDHEGFYWLKATDGNYYRLQFSKINQIGVNLLPFEIIGGNLVQAKGFFGWKAKSFPIEFLHPMSTVIYLGKSIQCPNNVQRYLKIKDIH